MSAIDLVFAVTIWLACNMAVWRMVVTRGSDTTVLKVKQDGRSTKVPMRRRRKNQKERQARARMKQLALITRMRRMQSGG